MGSIAKINGDTWHMASDIPYHRPGFFHFAKVKVMVEPTIWKIHLGVSENSVPLNPMVDDHYPY